MFNNILVLKELQLFLSNKQQSSESLDCERYNSVLEAYHAMVVYDEDEKIHKLWLNDEPLDSQSAIGTLTAIIESLEALHALKRGGVLNTASNSTAKSETKERVESSIADFFEKAQVVVGYYESNDILFLRDAFLNKAGLKLDADNAIIKDGCRTYLVPPFCGKDGLEVLNGLKETICIALLDTEKTKQILCPYRMQWVQHWVTICILVTNQNSVHFKYHDSANFCNGEEIETALQDFFQQQKAFSDFIEQSNRTPKLTKIDAQKRLKAIFFDEQGVRKINFENQGRSNIYAIQAGTGNAYCGGYTTRLIVSLALVAKQDLTKEAVWSCGGKEDKDLREEDAQTITEYNHSKINVFGCTGNGSGYKDTPTHLEKDAEQKRKTKEAFFQIEFILHRLDEKTLSDMYKIISESTLNLDDGGNIKNILIDIYKANKEKLSSNNPLSCFFEDRPVEINENSKLDSGLLFIELFKEFKNNLMKKFGTKIQTKQFNVGRDFIAIKNASAREMVVGGGSNSQDTIIFAGDVTTDVLQVDNLVIHQLYVNNKPALDEAALSPKQCLIELQKKLVEHCQDKHWYLKRLFDESKTPIENSYISLSIITTDEQQKKQEQLKEIDNAKLDRISPTIDERIPSHEDLFFDKEHIALPDLFKAQASEYEPPKRLIVFGRAGIGKSILCQYLAVRWYQEASENSAHLIMLNPSEEIKEKAEKVPLPWLQNFKLVFWIRLREIPPLFQVSKKNDFLKNIINHCCYGDKADQDMLELVIKTYQHESLFILDGYDEIEAFLDTDSPVYNAALSMAWNTLKEQTNVILTSRPRNLDLWPRDKAARRVEIMGFSNEQVEGYVQNFMAESSKDLSASDLLTYLKSRASIWGVAHIPINLEMLCWLYRKRKIRNEANSLSMLYEKIIEGVVLEMPKKHKALKKWLEAPMLGREGIQRYALKKIGLQFLEHLAYQGMLKNELLLSSETIELSAESVLGVHQISYDKCLTEKLLETSSQLGFLFSTGQGGKSIADQTHYFIHLSFQEHFGARYVASRLTSELEVKENHENTFINQLQETKHHSRYQLMWWLTAGLLAHQGAKKNDYSAIKIFARHMFLDFLSQNYMSELDFRLVTHCLDECIGSSPNILHKLFSDSEYENLKKKMEIYFRHVVFYSKSKLRQKTLGTLNRCSNFFSSEPFIDELFFEKLIALGRSRKVYSFIRMQIWKNLLKVPKYTQQAEQALIVCAQNKNNDINERMMAWEILIEIPKFIKKVTEELISLASDESIDFYSRKIVLEILLKAPMCAGPVTEVLIIWMQDKNIGAVEKMKVWETLLKIPEHAKQAAMSLIVLSEDDSIGIYDKQRIWKILLKTPEHKQMAAALIVWVKNKNIDIPSRIRVLELLLGISEYEKQAVEELIILVQEENISVLDRGHACDVLLETPKHIKQVAATLIVLGRDSSVNNYTRKKIWEALLEIPGYAKEAAVALIKEAENSTNNVHDRLKVLEKFLKISEYTKEAATALIGLAQDNKISDYDKRQALLMLLGTPEHTKQAAKILIALAQDNKIWVCSRIEALETLLKVPVYAKKSANRLIALAKDNSIDYYYKIEAWEVLLKNPEYIEKGVEALIVLAQDNKIRTCDRIKALKIILKVPAYLKKGANLLIVLAEDNSIEDCYKTEAWEVLLKIPEYTEKATEALIVLVLAEDKSVDVSSRIKSSKLLLEIPKYTEQILQVLTALAQDKNIDIDKRADIGEILLRNFEDVKQVARALAALAQDNKIKTGFRLKLLKTLLKIPDHAKQASEILILLAGDKTILISENRRACKSLLKIPEHTGKAIGSLIDLAYDPMSELDFSEKSTILEPLLVEVPEHAREVVKALIYLANHCDNDSGTRSSILENLLEKARYVKQVADALLALEDKNPFNRIDVCEILLKIPEYTSQAVKMLITMLQDKDISFFSARTKICEVLLKIPEYAPEVVETLTVVSTDESIDMCRRIEALEILLDVPDYAPKAAESLIILSQSESVAFFAAQGQADAPSEQTATHSTSFPNAVRFSQINNPNASSQMSVVLSEEEQPRVFRGRPRPVPIV